jgi:hypothetical protein
MDLHPATPTTDRKWLNSARHGFPHFGERPSLTQGWWSVWVGRRSIRGRYRPGIAITLLMN